MALQGPFVCCHQEHHPCHLSAHGSFYYVVTPGGARVNIGRSVDRGAGHLVYRRDYNFVRDYAIDFHWLMSMNGICIGILVGVQRCWYLKQVLSVHALEQLPVGLEGFFPAENVATCIVIKHGHWVCPILVLGRLMFNDTWRNFCNVHGLRIGWRVVFSCERRWVFNAFLFNEHGQQMTYNWSDPHESLQQLHPAPDHLHAAYLPSTFEHEVSLFRFVCEYTTDDGLRLVFWQFLADYIHHFNLEAVVFKAANKSWTIQVDEDDGFNTVAFESFCEDLFLGPFDYLMLGVCFDETI